MLNHRREPSNLCPLGARKKFALLSPSASLPLAALLLCGVAVCGWAQTTTVNLATQAKNPDFSSFPFTRPVTVGTTLPATCQVGQLFFNSAAVPGTNLYGCTAPNTWTTLMSGSAPTPQITLTPTSLSFGNQTTGTTSAGKTITLLNTGTTYLSITGISVNGPNGADFLASNTCGTIVASGASCTISVSFLPSTVGAEAAVLNINGNQPNSPVTLTLAGTGVAAITSGGLVLTPSAISAGENGAITFTSNRPVNWAMATGSSGTLVSSSSTSATYTAPPSIKAQNVLGGCQLLPNDSIFNTRIDNLPVAAQSATWTANTGTNGVTFLTAWGTNVADATTPVQNFSFYYTTGNNGPFVMPQWPSLKRENGTFETDRNSTDHHIVTVRKDTCQFYEIYNNYFTPRTCRDGVTQGCNATSGVTYGWNTYALPSNGSTDAAGLPIAPLTVHLDEIKSGAVNHAMRFTLAGGYIHATPYWPANSSNGCSSCTNSPPYGARFRLKANFDISKFSATAQVLLTALKQYGMILADAGTGPTIALATDVSEDPAVMQATYQIGNARITMSNFEAVDESNLMVSSNSSEVNPANGYVTPSGFAVVTATDQSNSNYQVSFPVALQAVAVGLPSPTLTILAGMTPYQLTAWTTGTTNQGVTWSLASGVGSITSGGLYTPPATVSSLSSAVVTATSAADPRASASLYITVLPIGTNPAGSIRIDSGSGTGVTDKAGNVWLPEIGVESGAYIQLSSDYPNWASLANNPEQFVYQSSGHTYGNDVVYSLVVPNGNYKVRLMLGQAYNGCGGNCGTFNPFWHAPLHLEANGQIAVHNFDFGLPLSYAYATPLDVYIPAQVTNNTLSVALRVNLPDNMTTVQPSPSINGLEIIPDSTAPYLAIDTQQQTSVPAGASLQLYATGWYMSNSVSWSTSGPGTISASGLYSAPATAGSGPQTVTITATSTVNSSVKTTATLTIPSA